MPLHPLPVLAGVYYCIVKGTAATKSVTNIFTFKFAGLPLGDPTDGAIALDLATQIGLHWPAFANALIADNYTATEAHVYPLGSPLVPAQISSFIAPGGIVTGYSFLQVAGLIKHTVIRRGKGSQSRTFVSPLSELSITTDGTQVTNAWVLAADTQIALFVNSVLAGISALHPGTWGYVQLSRRPVGATFPIVNSLATAQISSQDRRLGH